MISRPYFSLRKAFTYVLLIASLVPLIFISQFLTSRISDQLLSQKEHQIQNAVSTIAQEIVVEFDRIQQSLNWLSRDRFNIQALDNILYSSVVTHNLVRFSELSGLINSVYILNDKWEPLYDLNGRPYHFENSQLLREISVDKSIYEQGLTKAHFYTESNLIKGIHTAKGIALVTPMLAYNLEGSGRYRASGYVVVLISFDTIEQSFQHFLLKDENFNLNQHLDTHENVKSEMTESGILDRIFVLNNSSFSSPLALDITYQFSDVERLKEMKSSLLALFTVIGWTFVTVLFIAMGITRWISKEFVGMEDTIVSYASNKEVKDRTFQFSEFDRMALVLSKMSITIRNQLNELKNKNDELNDSKKVIERSNRKLSNFNQELEVQVSKQTAQLSDALTREELNKNSLAAVIEFGSIYKTLSYRELPQKVECQLQHLFSDTQWQLRFKPLGDKEGIQILSSKDKFLASLRFVSSPQLEANQLVFKLFVKQLSSWLELVDVARCDALLQCGNRKAFDEDLAHYQKRYRDSKAEWNFGLFILDVNGLKAINDQYGHDLGDELIRTSSSHISALLSENDSLYRIGGDEFALLTKGMTRKECTLLAEQLHVSQESLKFFDKEGKAYDANYSIGWSCSDNADLFKMFTIADESMYQDKREYYLHL